MDQTVPFAKELHIKHQTKKKHTGRLNKLFNQNYEGNTNFQTDITKQYSILCVHHHLNIVSWTSLKGFYYCDPIYSQLVAIIQCLVDHFARQLCCLVIEIQSKTLEIGHYNSPR